jgi:hypothetical protein
LSPTKKNSGLLQFPGRQGGLLTTQLQPPRTRLHDFPFLGSRKLQLSISLTPTQAVMPASFGGKGMAWSFPASSHQVSLTTTTRGWLLQGHIPPSTATLDPSRTEGPCNISPKSFMLPFTLDRGHWLLLYDFENLGSPHWGLSSCPQASSFSRGLTYNSLMSFQLSPQRQLLSWTWDCRERWWVGT